MEIGLVQHKGKGKDKGGKGKDGKKGKGKDQKGKGKDNHSKDKGGKGQASKDRCAICWKAGHTTEKSWFNTKGQEKGKGKKAVAAVNEGDNASIISAGPSASQVVGATAASSPFLPRLRRRTEKTRTSVRSGNTDFSW
jgi:hypothetical protein